MMDGSELLPHLISAWLSGNDDACRQLHRLETARIRTILEERLGMGLSRHSPMIQILKTALSAFLAMPPSSAHLDIETFQEMSLQFVLARQKDMVGEPDNALGLLCSIHVLSRSLPDLRRSLAQVLPDVDRRILYLRDSSRMSFKEIGEACSLDAAIAARRYKKALASLRRLLASIPREPAKPTQYHVDEIMEVHGAWLVNEVQSLRLQPGSARAEAACEPLDSGWDFVRTAVSEFLDAAPRFEIKSPELLRALLLWAIKSQKHRDYEWWRAKRIELAKARPTSLETVLRLD